MAGAHPPVVFVGGVTAALYPRADGVDFRATNNVDRVVDLTSTTDYYAFVSRLRSE